MGVGSGGDVGVGGGGSSAQDLFSHQRVHMRRLMTGHVVAVYTQNVAGLGGGRGVRGSGVGGGGGGGGYSL